MSNSNKILSKNEVIEVIELLNNEYPDASCELNYDSVYHLLLAVVLSAQTTDVSVNKITPKLFEKYKVPEDLANADEKEVQEIIKTIGLYRTKSKNIINLSKKLVSDFDGEVPNDFDKLICLPGVGRKTANVVLSEGFSVQRIAVDTHVFRVSNRIGIVNEDDVLKTEKALMEQIPNNLWSKTHHLLIIHGRRCCTAKKPKCANCPIKALCLESNELLLIQ